MSSLNSLYPGRESTQFSAPTPYQLVRTIFVPHAPRRTALTLLPDIQRSLVLDYLCHRCYTKTARAFAKDSTVRHLDADGDEIYSNKGLGSYSAELSEEVLKQVALREKIRAHILSGRVDDATDLLNEYFPSVLLGPIPDRLVPPSSEVSRTTFSSMDYVASTSVDPAHLTLNLRILSFIEACRTIPLEYPSITTSSDLTAKSEPQAAATDDQSSGSLEQQLTLLSKAQKLHALVNLLPKPSDRAIYFKELNNVGGLLAYKVPETSSISKYLSQERREAVADQINSAILNRTGLPSVSSLELLTRFTSTLWSFAHQHGVKALPGAILPPTSQQSPSKASDKEPETVPPFDLQQFLDLKT